MRPGQEPIRLLIVFTVYRSVDLLIDCMRSLAPQIGDVPGTFVGICANGERVDEVVRLRQAIREHGWSEWSWLREIRANRGFTGGNNAILEEALRWPEVPEYLLLLNTDTIAAPETLRRLVAYMDANPTVGIAGPQLTWPDGELQSCCFRDPTPISEFIGASATGPVERVLTRWTVAKPPPHASGPHDWRTFACAIIRREALLQAGVLDEGYFLYFDDPDLCWRVRKAGWKIGHCADATTVHLKGGSNDAQKLTRDKRRPPRYTYESRARFFTKRHGIVGLWFANLLWNAGRTISWTRELFSGKSRSVPEKRWRDIWINAFDPMRTPHLPHPPLDPCDIGLPQRAAGTPSGRRWSDPDPPGDTIASCEPSPGSRERTALSSTL